jgi:hypothetical protein
MATVRSDGNDYNGGFFAALVAELEHRDQAGRDVTDAAADFDPAVVRIERHRISVTQGEVSVSYRGELLGRYGDRIGLCTDSAHDHGGASCLSGWHGHGDSFWIDAARTAVVSAATGRPADQVKAVFDEIRAQPQADTYPEGLPLRSAPVLSGWVGMDLTC